jgi:hypothetical protein
LVLELVERLVESRPVVGALAFYPDRVAGSVARDLDSIAGISLAWVATLGELHVGDYTVVENSPGVAHSIVGQFLQLG